MKQTYSLKVLAAIVALAFTSSAVLAQCATFQKKKVMPKIAPFQLNGQVATSTLSSGQKTTLNVTFYQGQDYRIVVCGQPQLGDLSFKVLDATKKVVFDSRKNDSPDFWDFKVKNTQQFVVEVQVPESESTASIPPSGCVSIMVGFKKG